VASDAVGGVADDAHGAEVAVVHAVAEITQRPVALARVHPPRDLEEDALGVRARCAPGADHGDGHASALGEQEAIRWGVASARRRTGGGRSRDGQHGHREHGGRDEGDGRSVHSPVRESVSRMPSACPANEDAMEDRPKRVACGRRTAWRA